MISRVVGETRTIDDVIAVMRAIDDALDDGDGVKWFNLLYLRVTETIRADKDGWRDWGALERFDVAFARLYFDALLAAEQNPARVPPSWQPLFAARRNSKLARVQFALAGMNAHINRDLPVALEQRARIDGGFPPRDGNRYLDFLRVNDILEQTESVLRPLLATGLVRHIDEKLGDFDTVTVMWKVRKAREAGWTNGEVCWHLRMTPLLQRDFIARLDQMVAFAGRGLLVPRLGIEVPGV